MAQHSIQLVDLLRRTARALESSHDYQWGHMGLCNCGFLAQQISALPKSEIHGYAMQRHGDWTEQLNDYCPTRGYAMDELITQMLAIGFDADDLKHLERLSDPVILNRLPVDNRNLRHNVKSDVIRYLNTWAGHLEDLLTASIEFPMPCVVFEESLS